ncbi:amidohydrolase family protein [uncultured Ilumatobacter sp.]|jgi:N-acyl-D-amino-acid deacylase|uniref:N-acyl-D-amino-acid deacylase family protein n=1 Tax=uncultured Ilumatobacter sp. TaxID=879968 RepID=UPI00374E9512
MIELAIRDGLVADGTDSAPRLADVGISGGEIVEVGDVGAANLNLDAAGLVVAPGFVDAHTHDDMQLRRDPFNREKLLQGVTTVICGNCGFSAFPHRPGHTSPDLLSTDGPWESFGSYAQALRAQGIGPNMATFVGHNTASRHIDPRVDRRPDRRHRTQIVDQIRRSVEEGALGVSSGLIYEPGRFSVIEDLIEIATAAAEHGGLYCSHVRDEGAGLLDSIDEALTIAHESGAGLQLSHLKTVGRGNWGLVKTALDRIDAAHQGGLDIGFDVYPYTAGSGPFEQYFDSDNVDIARLEFVQIVHCPDFPQFEGLRVPAIAAAEGRSTEDVTRQIIAGLRATETVCVIFEIDENEMRSVLAHPRAMIGSDGIPQDGGVPHPRLIGAFPRVLGQYGRDEGLFDLSAAVMKMTSIPARRFGLTGRGCIRPGYSADITIFDHSTVKDRATYQERNSPEGIQWVLVNGKIAVTPEGLGSVLAGQVLTRAPNDN